MCICEVARRDSFRSLASHFERLTKFIDREHLAGVSGMFALDPLLEDGCVLRQVGGRATVHFISTLATGDWAGYSLRLESTLARLNFVLELLFD